MHSAHLPDGSPKPNLAMRSISTQVVGTIQQNGACASTSASVYLPLYVWGLPRLLAGTFRALLVFGYESREERIERPAQRLSPSSLLGFSLHVLLSLTSLELLAAKALRATQRG